VWNTATVTQRNSRLNVSNASGTVTNRIQETQSPRILRFSGRVTF